jgi:hypothetical protein
MKSWKKELLKEWWNDNLDYFPLGAKFRRKWQKSITSSIIQELDNRRLDIDIAQKIFGYEINVHTRTEYKEYGSQTDYPELQYVKTVHKNGDWDKSDYKEWETLPHYSTDLKDSFLIVEKFQNELSGVEIMCGSPTLKGQNYHVKLYNNVYSYSLTYGDTIELAICNAALAIKNET